MALVTLKASLTGLGLRPLRRHRWLERSVGLAALLLLWACASARAPGSLADRTQAPTKAATCTEPVAPCGAAPLPESRMAAAFQAVTTHTQGEMGVVGAVLEPSSDKPLADVVVTGSLRQAGRERENVIVTDRQGRFRMSGLYEDPSANDIMCDACTIRFEVEDHYSVSRPIRLRPDTTIEVTVRLPALAWSHTCRRCW